MKFDEQSYKFCKYAKSWFDEISLDIWIIGIKSSGNKYIKRLGGLVISMVGGSVMSRRNAQ